MQAGRADPTQLEIKRGQRDKERALQVKPNNQPVPLSVASPFWTTRPALHASLTSFWNKSKNSNKIQKAAKKEGIIIASTSTRGYALEIGRACL
jgi:hypothetical protein